MYVREVDNKLTFLDPDINTIKESDILISDEDYKQYFTLLSSGYRIKVTSKIIKGQPLFNFLSVEKIEKTNVPNEQDKLNADLIKQNAELKLKIEKQKELNSQILLELAKLKQGGGSNV